MQTDREKIPLVLRRTKHGLEPVSCHEADMLAEYSMGSDVEVTIKKRRSLPQLRLYWAILHGVVETTGVYPSAEHLHDALKMELGYTMPVKTLRGKIIYVPDSAAMAKMDAVTFKAFFDAAMAKIAEVYGFDPLEMGAGA